MLSDFFLSILLRSVGMSLAVIAVWAASPILTRCCRARWRYALWTAATLAFLFPPIPFASAILLPRPQATAVIVPTAREVSPNFLFEKGGQISESAAQARERTSLLRESPSTPSERRYLPSSASPTPSAETKAVGEGFSFDLRVLLSRLGVVWLLGAAVALVAQGVGYRRFCLTAARWSEPVTNDELLRLFDSLKKELGINAAIRLRTVRGFASPMMYGFLTPTILLPAGLVSRDGNEERSGQKPLEWEEFAFILKHELIHFKRRDIWVRLLTFAAVTVHWFNPMARLAARRAETECETSCDERIVESVDTVGRRVYAETILGVIQGQARRATLLSTQFYGGKSGMKQRINTIFDTRGKRFGAILFAALLPLVFLGAVLVGVRAEEKTEAVLTPASSGDGGQAALENSTTPRSRPTEAVEEDALTDLVRDEAGNPIPKATVTLLIRKVQPYGAPEDVGERTTSTTDNTGRFRLPTPKAAPNTTWTLRVEKEGFVPSEFATNNLNRIKSLSRPFTLDAGKPLSGRVIDVEGKPAANTPISIYTNRLVPEDPTYGMTIDHSAWIETTTDDAGRFRADIYAEGETYLTVTPEKFAPLVLSYRKFSGDVGDLTLREGIEPTVTLLDKNGRPVPNMPILMEGDLNHRCPYHITDGSRYAVTDERGVACFGPLAPGNVTLRIDPERGKIGTGRQPVPFFKEEIGTFATMISGKLDFECRNMTVRASETVTLTLKFASPVAPKNKDSVYIALSGSFPCPLTANADRSDVETNAFLMINNKELEVIDDHTIRASGLPAETKEIDFRFNFTPDTMMTALTLPGDPQPKPIYNNFVRVAVEKLTSGTVEVASAQSVNAKIRVVDADGNPVETFIVFGSYKNHREADNGGKWSDVTDDAAALRDFAVKDAIRYLALIKEPVCDQIERMDTTFNAKNLQDGVYTQTRLRPGEEVTFFAVTADGRQGSVKIDSLAEGQTRETTIKLGR